MIKLRIYLFLALVSLIVGCDKLGLSAPTFKSVDVTGADFARELSLTDQLGQGRTLAEFKGKVLVVFFGYTQCPDVCPTTMVELAQVKKALGEDGKRVQAIFITVDPERDTTPILASYMASFDPDFLALRGTLEQTAAVAKEFKVFYAKAQSKNKGSYTVDHTAGSYIFDASGRLRLFAPYGLGHESLTADLKALLASG